MGSAGVLIFAPSFEAGEIIAAGSIAVAAARAGATVSAVAPAAIAPRTDLLLCGLPGDCRASIADVFVGGVLCTLSAWVIWTASFVARVRAGAEATTSPRLAFVVPRFHGQVN